MVVALAAGAWLWPHADAIDVRVAAVHSPLPSDPPPAAASAAAPPPPLVPQTGASAAVNPADATAAMHLRMEPSLSARKALDALLATTPPAVAHTSPTPAPAVPPPPAAVLTPAPASAPAPTATATDRSKARAAVAATLAPLSPASDNATSVQRQQQASIDAIAQAQSLWNNGAHDTAMELMQQSIAAAERTAKAGTNTGGNAVLLPLVREMTRMQLADGRFGAVWELLNRLESQLSNQPDLWAIRANAAQRLGHHQDSVHAYMVALQSRPDEQRWLLGTAVSLAALGQTSSAAEMAEKARAVGPVGKDILNYLHQAGVPLREQ